MTRFVLVANPLFSQDVNVRQRLCVCREGLLQCQHVNL